MTVPQIIFLRLPEVQLEVTNCDLKNGKMCLQKKAQKTKIK